MSYPNNGERVVSILLLAALLLLADVAGAQSPPEKSDIRVLIDISGSMRQNDPNNLRRPALRMLAGLMQPGTRAGVWTFARWVNNLVPVAEVDAAWKKKVKSLSEQIASPGQFTNIEEVLDLASRDWTGEPTTHARHLVLLTDGMVDVSKDAGENARSRDKILDSLLPRLQQAGVKVHTIALSERADHELMRRLAGETGGWYQQVDEADRLQRVFLKMFETVSKPDAVPLQDNRFTVDGSISEATVLVFSKPDAVPIVLRSPNGDEFTDSDLPAGVAWFRDKGYDMITIDKPQKGEWSLQADVDPDNRVMIVTDLKLRTSELPTHLAVGEEVYVEAYLSNRGKLVDRQAFLRLLDVRADAISSDGTDPLGLNDAGNNGDRQAQDGRYGMQFAERRARAEVELLVAVDSPTFVRQKRFRMAVHEIAEGAVTETTDGPVFELQANGTVLQPGASAEAWQTDGSGQKTSLTLEPGEAGHWQASLVDPAAPVHARVSATSRLGNLVNTQLGPIMPPGVPVPPAVVEPTPAAVEPELEAEAPPPSPAEPVAAEPPSEPTAEPPPVSEEEPEAESWVMPAALFGGFNLLLVIGVGTWWFLRRRRAGTEDDELDLDALVGGADEGTPGDDPSREEAA
jgi:Mg-chelatase subunit ChlD